MSWWSNITKAVQSAVQKVVSAFTPAQSVPQNVPSITRPSPSFTPSQTAASTISAVDKSNVPVRTTPASQPNIQPTGSSSGTSQLSNLQTPTLSSSTLQTQTPQSVTPSIPSSLTGVSAEPSVWSDLSNSWSTRFNVQPSSLIGSTIGLTGFTSLTAAIPKAVDMVDAAASKTSLGKLLQIGKSGKVGIGAVNTKNVALTGSWLSRIAEGIVNNPALVGAILVESLGTYPFAGFLKEEALQTIGMSTDKALKKGDLENAAKSIQLQEDILNPSLWSKIFSAIPNANVLAQLKNFYKASAQKLEVDKTDFQKQTDELQRGNITKELAKDLDAPDWEKINQERDARRQLEIRQDEERQLRYIDAWNKARAENRAADEAYWKQKQAEQEALIEKKRKEDAEFWAEIFRQQEERRKKKRAEDTAFWANVNKQRENAQPSKLRFRFL